MQMVVRKRRKKNKLRAQRTHGKGDTKNKRGAGCRGGRGRAGSHKHKYSKYYGTFGKEKKKVRGKKKGMEVNLEQLQLMLPRWGKGKVEKKENSFVVDGKKAGIGKVLSRGEISEKIVLKNARASKRAKEKIEKAGGKVEETGEKEGEKK